MTIAGLHVMSPRDALVRTDLVKRLPAVLASAKSDAMAHPVAALSACRAACAAVGHSAGLGRAAAYVFTATNDFEADLTLAWSSPQLAPADAFVTEEHAILAAAYEQITQFRASTVPAATGGRLLVARINGSGVTTRVVFDFARTSESAAPCSVVALRGAAVASEAASWGCRSAPTCALGCTPA